MKKQLCMCAAILLSAEIMLQTAVSKTVSAADTISALHTHLLGKSSISEAEAAAADADGNGILNAIDLTLLKRSRLQHTSSLCINEVCTSNHTAYITKNNAKPDFIELFYSGSTPLDLSGYGLSDRETDPWRFTFPAGTIITENTHLLVLCDDTAASDTELHAPFKLSASGETVYLSAPKTSEDTSFLLDSVTVPALETDIVFGRIADGAASWDRMNPSPGTENQLAPPLTIPEIPVFSRNAGFYDDAFSLVLTAPEGCTIRYTTDCSDPCTSETAVKYTEPITIYNNTAEPNRESAVQKISDVARVSLRDPVEKGMIIRAVTVSPDGICSRVITNGYYIGKTAPYYHDLRVLSVTTDYPNLFDAESGIYLYDNCLNKGREWERPAHIQVYEDGAASYAEDVGVRIAGGFSRHYPQKSMTFYARNVYGASKMKYDFFDGAARDCYGKKIKEFDTVTIRNGGESYDNARFRDDLNVWLASGMALSVQAKNDYVVFLNGEFWGYYSMQEKLDDAYFSSHYHLDKDNITYIKNCECEGDTKTYMYFLNMISWAAEADFTDPKNYQNFCAQVDVQSFIDFIIAESCICNSDSLININNQQLWRVNVPDDSSPYADGKWRFSLFDTEYSSGYGTMQYNYNYLANMNQQSNPFAFGGVFYRLLANPDFAALFRASYVDALEQHFSAERAVAKIDDYLDRLSDVYTATGARFGYTFDRDRQGNLVKQFWERRGDYALRQADAIIAKYQQ